MKKRRPAATTTLLAAALVLSACGTTPAKSETGADQLMTPTFGAQQENVRAGVVHRDDVQLSLVGPETRVGDMAPNATLRDKALERVDIDFKDGKTRVVLFVPSLDTPTCSIQARKFNSKASRLADDVEVLIISRDLPYAQARFCGANGLKRVITYSDYASGDFGKAWGYYVKETDLLARVVAIVDGKGAVRYLEVVANIPDQPNYISAMEALKALVPESVKEAPAPAEGAEAPAEDSP